jgi:hypothetical protein
VRLEYRIDVGEKVYLPTGKARKFHHEIDLLNEPENVAESNQHIDVAIRAFFWA